MRTGKQQRAPTYPAPTHIRSGMLLPVPQYPGPHTHIRAGMPLHNPHIDTHTN